MYKKKYFYFNSDIVLSLSFIAYGQNFVPYQNPRRDFLFKFQLDGNRVHKIFMAKKVIYFILQWSHNKTSFKKTIQYEFFPLQYQMDLDTLANMYTQQSQSQIPNLQVVQSQNITLGNVPAKYALYTGSMQQMNMAFLVVYIINQNQAYILQCTSDANKYQQYQAVFSQVLGSFSSWQFNQHLSKKQPFPKQNASLKQTNNPSNNQHL